MKRSLNQKALLMLIAVTMLFSLSFCGKKAEKETEVKSDVVKVVAKDFSFISPDTIKSGWNEFLFENSGHAEHFFFLNKLPDSITFSHYFESVVVPFQVIFDSLKAGWTHTDAIGLLVGTLPPWYFSEVQQMGGTGIVDHHMSTSVTMNLLPGRYAMECYIKEKGTFHALLGMIKEINVSEEVSAVTPPQANYELTLTNFKYEAIGELKAGKNIVAVHFNEHPELGLGNDVHLIEMTDTTKIEDVINWLNWLNVEGLQTPSPVRFLGGMQEMPVGNTAYFTVDLKPGNYAWVAESSADKGMIEYFSIE